VERGYTGRAVPPETMWLALLASVLLASGANGASYGRLTINIILVLIVALYIINILLLIILLPFSFVVLFL